MKKMITFSWFLNHKPHYYCSVLGKAHGCCSQLRVVLLSRVCLAMSGDIFVTLWWKGGVLLGRDAGKHPSRLALPK